MALPVVLLSVVLAILAASPASALQCASSDSADDEGAPIATFVLLPGQGTSLDFGEGRVERRLELEFAVEGCKFPSGTEIEGNKGVFSSKEADFPAELISVSATASRTVATVVVLVNPTDVRAGTYTGNLRIDDPRGHIFRIPLVTITLKKHLSPLVLLVSLVGIVLFGSAVVWGKGRLAGGKDNFFWSWWAKIGNLLAVGAGLVAVWGAWKAGYVDDADWGANMLIDAVTLAGVVFVAYVAAATTASLGGDKSRGGPDKKRLSRSP